MLEHSDDGALGFWCTGMLEHWDTGAHRRCNRKFECGNLVEFDLSADGVHEYNCTRSPILHSLYININWDYYVKSGEIFNKLTVKQLNIYLKEHKNEQNEYRLPRKLRQIEFVHLICLIKTKRKIKKPVQL